IEGNNKRMLVWNYDRVWFRSSYGQYGYPTELVWSPDGKYLLYARSAWGIFSDMVVASISNPFKRLKLNYVPGGTIRGMSWAKQ
ncbi:MAG: hypothetical protein NT033_09955, partial [Candidatus Omnitrophica bacterium]|nr:hypothetical protein [Candidatus Omnitrophota bacterium]